MEPLYQWIGLREILQEKPMIYCIFTGKIYGFRLRFSRENQSIDCKIIFQAMGLPPGPSPEVGNLRCVGPAKTATCLVPSSCYLRAKEIQRIHWTLRCHQTWQAGKFFMKLIHGNYIYIYIAGKIAGKINYGWNQLRMILIYANPFCWVWLSPVGDANEFSLTAPRHHWARRTWRLWAQRGCNNPHLSRNDWPNTELWELRAPSSQWSVDFQKGASLCLFISAQILHHLQSAISINNPWRIHGAGILMLT